MPALTEMPELIGFFSYSRDDDRDSDGFLTRLRRRIQSELRGQIGRSERTLRLWQDAEAIAPGTLWEAEITAAIEQSVFFIPIVSPRVIRSEHCGIEFKKFLDREKQLGRSDLVFPIIYIDVPQLKDKVQLREHPTVSIVGARQHVDWTELRFETDPAKIGKAVAALCSKIVAALERNRPAPPKEKPAPVIVAQPETSNPPRMSVDSTAPTETTPTPQLLPEKHDFDRRTGPRVSQEILRLIGCLLLVEGLFGAGTIISLIDNNLAFFFVNGAWANVLPYYAYAFFHACAAVVGLYLLVGKRPGVRLQTITRAVMIASLAACLFYFIRLLVLGSLLVVFNGRPGQLVVMAIGVVIYGLAVWALKTPKTR